LEERQAERKRGILHLVMALASAFLIISPSYVGYYLLTRAKLSISLIAIVSLAMFLVGAYLIINLLKE